MGKKKKERKRYGGFEALALTWVQYASSVRIATQRDNSGAKSLNSERFHCRFGKHPDACWAGVKGQGRIACDLTSPRPGVTWSKHIAA